MGFRPGHVFGNGLFFVTEQTTEFGVVATVSREAKRVHPPYKLEDPLRPPLLTGAVVDSSGLAGLIQRAIVRIGEKRKGGKNFFIGRQLEQSACHHVLPPLLPLGR